MTLCLKLSQAPAAAPLKLKMNNWNEPFFSLSERHWCTLKQGSIYRKKCLIWPDKNSLFLLAPIVRPGNPLKETLPESFLNTLLSRCFSRSAVAFFGTEKWNAEGFPRLASWTACESHARPYYQSNARSPWHFLFRNVTWTQNVTIVKPWSCFISFRGRNAFLCLELT